MVIDEGTAMSLAINLVGIGLFGGIMKAGQAAIKETLMRLEKKQDKHNGLIERMVKVEESTKSAHHRLDDMKEAECTQ